jgi:hypothetical protein
MAMAASDRRMSVGRVFERAFAAIRCNPLMIVGLSVLCGALPAVGVQYVISQIPSYAFVMTVGSFVLPGFFALFLVQWFFSLAIGALVLGALTRPVIAADAGRKAGVGETFAALGSSLIPLIVLGVLTGIATVIASTLLIVPGIIVFLLWVVAAPALVDEREGVFLALSRSQELTEGARWKTFAIVLILIAVSIVLMFLTGLFAVLLRSLMFGPNFELWRLGLLGLLSTMANVIWGTVQVALFVELREWKEGGPNLGDVFA